MIKIKGFDHVAINVRDIDKSVAWYEKVFGLKVTKREPSKAGVEYFLDCGPSLLGIIQAQDLGNVHPFANEGVGANHFSFRIDASDFDEFIKHLETNDVKIEFAKKREKSWSIYFYDLDGNKLEATAWPREDKIADEKCVKLKYDPQTKNWLPY